MANLRPFNFSVAFGKGPKTRQEWLGLARQAEDLGYTTLLATDHVDYDVDPVVTLMALADATSLRIGSHVYCNDFRHPVVLAREVASLDVLSEGRFRFGFGCGYLATDYTRAGIPFDANGLRIARFEEATRLIKGYFQGEELLNFSGRYYQTKDLPIAIKPLQKPYPPIYMGGGGKRVLSFAAQEADIIGLAPRNNAQGLDWSTTLPEANLEKLAWVRDAAGDRFHEIELSMTIFIAAVTDHSAQAAFGISQRLGLAPDQVPHSSPVLVGSVDQIVDELLSRREQLGVSSFEIQSKDMEALAPVVARLAGR
jgi:probable F420-dependent oxidoreductase